MKKYEFDTVIIRNGTMDAAYIEFPYDVEKEFGTRGQVKVQASFDGYEYRGSLSKMGADCHILGITKEIRSSIGKQPGDTVHIVLQQDDKPRVVEVPEDLKKLLDQNEEAKSFFDTLSYSNQNKYVQWITSAKKAETRSSRVEESISMLSNKIKRT